MGEIGSGTGTSYPTTLDNDIIKEVNSPNAGKTKARAEVINDLGSAVVAIEAALGTTPQGSKTDVKTFLQAEHNADGTHDNTKIAMLTGTQTFTGVKIFNNTSQLLAEIGSNPFTLYKDAMRSWLFKYTNSDTAVGGVDTLALTTDGSGSSLKLYFPDETGGMRMWLWPAGVAVPNLPHTGITPTFAVYGDLLVGDIIALESNPMTLFMRQNTGLAVTATTQFFSARAINNDTDGGAGVILTPKTGGTDSDGQINLIAYGTGSGVNANGVFFSSRLSSGTIQRNAVSKLKVFGFNWGAAAEDGSGNGVLHISNRTTAPTVDATAGGFLYSEAGALKWRGSAGTITQIAPA